MKVLLGCEESQAVTIEFRKLGVEAFSCDIKDCTGGFPNWHIKEDIFNVANNEWDMLIAFPPCTHLALSGSQWFKEKIKDGRQKDAIDFFLKIANLEITHIAIENPMGIMGKHFKKPDQIIQPYFFGDPFQKTTCLWLKNLPKLYHNDKVNLFDDVITHTNKGDFFYWIDKKTGKEKKQPLWYKNARNNKDSSTIRSKTFLGIAKAMALQWTEFFKNQKLKK